MLAMPDSSILSGVDVSEHPFQRVGSRCPKSSVHVHNLSTTGGVNPRPSYVLTVVKRTA